MRLNTSTLSNINFDSNKYDDEIALLRNDDIPYDSRQINGYSELTLITGRIEYVNSSSMYGRIEST